MFLSFGLLTKSSHKYQKAYTMIASCIVRMLPQIINIQAVKWPWYQKLWKTIVWSKLSTKLHRDKLQILEENLN